MTRLLTEGFEVPNFMTPLSFQGSALHTWYTTTKRSGAYCLQLAGNGTNSEFVRYGLPTTSETQLYFRMGFNVAATNLQREFVRIASNVTASLVTLFLQVGFPFELRVNGTARVTSAFNVVANQWYLIEIYVNMADSGSVTLKIDGTEVGTWSGDTKPSTDAYLASISFGQLGAQGANNNSYYDDIAVNSVGGTVDNSWCGDGKVVAIRPSGNGSVSQLTGSDGNTTDNYLLVDEVTPDADTTYVTSGTADQYDLYALENPTIPAGASILRVQPRMISREETATGESAQVGIKSGSQERWSANIPQATAYAMYTGDDYLLDPDTNSAWTATAINNLEAGVKVK